MEIRLFLLGSCLILACVLLWYFQEDEIVDWSFYRRDAPSKKFIDQILRDEKHIKTMEMH
jgi:hypothetical protein